MRRYDELIWKGLAGLAAAAALTLGEPVQAQVPRYDHIVVVIFENHSYTQIIGNPQAPHFNALAANGANFVPDLNDQIGVMSGSTVLVINYDEWGGFFDHIAPPVAPVPDATRTAGIAERIDVNDPKFGLLGFRTPNLIVSLLARRGYLAHDRFDHTSILRMIEWRFGLAPLTVRNGTANNLATLLDFNQRNVSFNTYPVPAAADMPCV